MKILVTCGMTLCGMVLEESDASIFKIVQAPLLDCPEDGSSKLSETLVPIYQNQNTCILNTTVRIMRVFYLPTDAQESCFIKNIEIYINPYPTAFPYGNGMVLHFYQQQESSTTKTVHKVIN